MKLIINKRKLKENGMRSKKIDAVLVTFKKTELDDFRLRMLVILKMARQNKFKSFVNFPYCVFSG